MSPQSIEVQYINMKQELDGRVLPTQPHSPACSLNASLEHCLTTLACGPRALPCTLRMFNMSVSKMGKCKGFSLQKSSK